MGLIAKIDFCAHVLADAIGRHRDPFVYHRRFEFIAVRNVSGFCAWRMSAARNGRRDELGIAPHAPLRVSTLKLPLAVRSLATNLNRKIVK